MNNYHTHTKYCNHAEGTVEDYVKSAIECGIGELGMSDHAPIPRDFMSEEEYLVNCCDENMSNEIAIKYINEIEECKEKYKDQIKIYSGFETEFVLNHLDFYQDLRNKVDYLNVGIHFFSLGDKIIDTYHDVNYKNVDYYLYSCIEAMKSGLFNTLVHPDLFMYNYYSANGKYRDFDADARRVTKAICEAAIKYNVYLEVNANGIRNSIRKGYTNESEWLYPCVEFWKVAKEYKELKIIIGADAHSPKFFFSEYIELAKDFCKRLNLNILEKMEINH